MHHKFYSPKLCGTSQRSENRLLNRKVVAAIAVFLVAIAILSTLIAVSANNIFLFSNDLAVKEIASPDGGFNHYFDLYLANVYFGELSVQVGSTTGIFTQITFDEDNTKSNYVVDTITLRFSSEPSSPAVVYMEGNYPAVPTTFTQTNQGVTIIALKSMEVYRGGSAPVNFAVQSYQNKNLSVTADVTYHETSFLQLTCLKAHFSVNLQVPTN